MTVDNWTLLDEKPKCLQPKKINYYTPNKPSNIHVCIKICMIFGFAQRK